MVFCQTSSWIAINDMAVVGRGVAECAIHSMCLHGLDIRSRVCGGTLLRLRNRRREVVVVCLPEVQNRDERLGRGSGGACLSLVMAGDLA